MGEKVPIEQGLVNGNIILYPLSLGADVEDGLDIILYILLPTFFLYVSIEIFWNCFYVIIDLCFSLLQYDHTFFNDKFFYHQVQF